MKNHQRWRALTLASGVLSVAGLAVLFLGLHDIRHDYASPATMSRIAGSGAEALPKWSACAGEWHAIAAGFWVVTAFHVLFFTGVIGSARAKRSAAGDR